MGLLETPLLAGSARRVGGPMAFMVRAATAAPAGSMWVSALRCRRRPDRCPCSGRVVLYRAETPAPIQWGCSLCASHGSIDGWVRSAFDLRGMHLAAAAAPGPTVLVSDEVADVLRGLLLLDDNTERAVFAAQAAAGGALIAAAERELQDLLGFLAAEANQERSARRQRRLDEAFDALVDSRSQIRAPAARATDGPSS